MQKAKLVIAFVLGVVLSSAMPRNEIAPNPPQPDGEWQTVSNDPAHEYLTQLAKALGRNKDFPEYVRAHRPDETQVEWIARTKRANSEASEPIDKVLDEAAKGGDRDKLAAAFEKLIDSWSNYK